MSTLYPKPMTDFDTAKSQMRLAAEAFIRAEDVRDEALLALREICPHTILLESPYVRGEWFSDTMPKRCCEDCGLQENYPFRVLTGRAYRVDGAHMLSRAEGFIKTGLAYEQSVVRWDKKKKLGLD